MTEIIFMVEDDIEGGYVAKALNAGIITQGDTLDELKLNIFDALKCHFDNESDIPKIVKLHIIKEEVLRYA